MRGTKHSVIGFPGGVELTNIEDTHYDCIFETPMELASFIEELREAGKRAFGDEMTEFPDQGGNE